MRVRSFAPPNYIQEWFKLLACMEHTFPKRDCNSCWEKIEDILHNKCFEEWQREGD